MIASDLTRLNATLDPLLLALYAMAWLGAAGAVVTLLAAVQFWGHRVGSLPEPSAQSYPIAWG